MIFCAKLETLWTCTLLAPTGTINLFLMAALLCWPTAPLAPGALNGQDHFRVIYSRRLCSDCM
jgi:hypothetical protein